MWEQRWANEVVSRANEATESVSDAVRAATDKVNEGRETAADRLEGAASTVHERADQLPGGPTVKEFAHAAADRLSSTANYVRTHDATRMMADIESVVKRIQVRHSSLRRHSDSSLAGLSPQ